MKYALILGDGMADQPLEEIGGKTILEHANTPCMDELAPKSEIGMVLTVPKGMAPGSDTANLSVMGYDPNIYYTGRSPLEALSIGVPMDDTDVALRCNIIMISEEEDIPFEERLIVDHSGGDLTQEEAAVLVDVLKKEFDSEDLQLWLGTSYRHCLIWKNGKVETLYAPHDHLTEKCGQYLPQNERFLEMTKRSYEILKDHPINVKRREAGENTANCIWLWGAGTKPLLSNFQEKTGKKGAMISAVDLLKGLAVGADMTNYHIEGATGLLNSNFEGKVEAALKALLEDGNDFVYVHVEATDEMGHAGSIEKKTEAVEVLDSRVIKPIYEGLKASGEDFKLMILPDHPTPVCIRTHTGDAVPFMIYDSTAEKNMDHKYTEKEAEAGGLYIEYGFQLIDRFFN